MMDYKTTESGFRLISFKDDYNNACSLQKSSSAKADKIWFGMDNQYGHDGIPYGRMHLTRAQVAELLPVLQFFVETGELPTDNYETDIAIKEAEKAYQRSQITALEMTIDFLKSIVDGSAILPREVTK